MNILAHLQFGDNRSAHYHQEYLVVGCRTHLMRRYGTYRPESAPGFDSLEVTLIAPGKEDLSLYEWYFNNTMRNGRLCFDLLDVRTQGDDEVQRVYAFEGAQCYALSERDDLHNRSQRLLTLKLTAKLFTVDQVAFGEDPDMLF